MDILAIVSSVAMNIGAHVSFRIRVFSGYVPRCGISGSYATGVLYLEWFYYIAPFWEISLISQFYWDKFSFEWPVSAVWDEHSCSPQCSSQSYDKLDYDSVFYFKLLKISLFWRNYIPLRTPRWLSGKESACNAGDSGLIPGWERFPGGGNGNSLQYSYLGNHMDRGAWWATVHGGLKKSVVCACEWLGDNFPCWSITLSWHCGVTH